MDRYKYLIMNTIIFALSNVLVKLLSFVMLPLYTGVLSTADYGTVELINVTITLLIPIFTLSISQAVIRFTFIEDVSKSTILTNGLLITFIGAIVMIVTYPIFKIFDAVILEYYPYVMLIFVTTVVEQLFFNFAKGIENVKVCAMNSVVSVVVSIIANIVLLLVFKMGIDGYLISIVASECICCAYIFFRAGLRKYINIKSLDIKILNEMLTYSIPFIFTSIAWWVNAVSDRYVIVYLVGIASNGLYSVAGKLPSITSLVTSVFNQAWQISGIKEYEDSSYEEFFSKIYGMYNVVMVIISSILILISPFLAKFLFKGQFYIAWKFTPFLLIGTIFSGLSGVIATVFFAIKKTKILMISTISGAIINLILNFLLVGVIGVQGAAIATMISFIIVWFVRYINSKKYITIKIKWAPTLCLYALLIIQSVVMISECSHYFLLSSVIVFMILLFNFYECMQLIHFSRKLIVDFKNKRK